MCRSSRGSVWGWAPRRYHCSRTRRIPRTPCLSGASRTCTCQCNAGTGRSSWAGKYRSRCPRRSPSRTQICTGCRTRNRTACPRTCTPSGSSHRFGRRGAWAGCSRRCSFHYRPWDTRAGWAPRVQGVCSWKDYPDRPTRPAGPRTSAGMVDQGRWRMRPCPVWTHSTCSRCHRHHRRWCYRVHTVRRSCRRHRRDSRSHGRRCYSPRRRSRGMYHHRNDLWGARPRPSIRARRRRRAKDRSGGNRADRRDRYLVWSCSSHQLHSHSPVLCRG